MITAMGVQLQPGDPMRIVVILVLLPALAITGCDFRVHTESRTISESISYGDAEDQERFKQALSAAGIPYEVVVERRNQEFVRWDAAHGEAVERIKETLFLPSGRHISLDDQRQARFKAWLEQRRIPYRTMMQNQREYVVWEEADAERVRAWPEFPPYYDNPPNSSRR